MLAGLMSLWAESLGEPGICIAVLDGPVDLSHPCFAHAQLSQLETLVSGVANQGLASQHGTHAASLIWGHHGSSVHGIAPGCRGLIVPVFTEGEDGRLVPCSQIDLARAITQAVEHGAHVINISGGELTPSGEPHPLLARAVRLCADNHVLIVAAAGNDGCRCLHVPAAIPSVLAVGAMDAQGAPLPFSNWGPLYQIQGILAPGENLLGAMPGGGTSLRSGTSFATPIVSGIVGLLLSLQLKWGDKPDPIAVRTAILKSALPCNPQEALDCRRFMVGSLNVAGAYRLIAEGRENPLGVASSVRVAEKAAVDPEAPRMMPSVVGVAASVGPCALTKSKEGYVSDQQPTINIHQRNGASIWPKKATHQLSTLSESKALWDSTALITPSQVHPATNGGSCGSPLPLVYALGTIGYDFGSEVRRDAITQHMAGTNPNPSDPAQFLTYLGQQPYEAAAVIWTLNLDVTTIYAIRPAGPYASLAYERLREFLNAQLTEGVQLVATPGFLLGTVTLLSGQNVPQLVPDLRGMASWSTGALVQAVLGTPPEQEALRTTYEQQQSGITNFLQRVYYDLRNLGLSPQERAINYAATNAFQVERVFEQAVSASLALDSITVERSTVCRPDSDCWDVKLIFFNPTRRLEQARRLYRFTVDVSDVVPVTVGPVRSWFIY